MSAQIPCGEDDIVTDSEEGRAELGGGDTVRDQMVKSSPAMPRPTGQ